MENATKPKTTREWLMVIYNEVKGHKRRIARLEWFAVSVMLLLVAAVITKVVAGQ